MSRKSILYILDKHGVPRSVPYGGGWGAWFEANKEARLVNQEPVGDLIVSTVFLGIDQAFGEGRGPILWETMVFRNGEATELDRCGGSREQAEEMHRRMVARIKRRLKRASKARG